MLVGTACRLARQKGAVRPCEIGMRFWLEQAEAELRVLA
jgi:hypothetical protein